MNMYLDIDGVLLANDKNAANHVHEFLAFVTSNHTVYWLTSHCQGDASTAVSRLATVFEPRTLALTRGIRPTRWSNAKTEAIDFSQPFLWFDDDLFPEERSELIRHDALASWVEVNLREDPNALQRILENR